MVEWHKSDLCNRMYINVGDGKKAAMPRYFKDKIYSKRVVVSDVDTDGNVKIREVILGERDTIAIHHKVRAEENMLKKEKELKDRHGENWLKVKVEIDKQSFEKMYQDAEKNRNKI